MCRVLIFAFVIAVTTGTIVQKCSKIPLPKAVRIYDCDSPPCKVVKESNAVMEVDFKMPHETKAITANVMTTVNGVTKPFTLSRKTANVCSDLLHGVQCPLRKGAEATYFFFMRIPEKYPEIPVKVQFTFVDDKNKELFCFSTDIQVTK